MTRVGRPTSGFKTQARQRLEQELVDTKSRSGGTLPASTGRDISLPSDVGPRVAAVDIALEART